MLLNGSIYKENKKIGRCDLESLTSSDVTNSEFIWLALQDPSESEMAILQKCFSLHPLAIEDTLRVNQRAKIEEYQDVLFIVMQLPEIDGQSLHIGSLCIFASNSFLLSIRSQCNQTYHHVRERCERESDQFDIGPGYALHALIDATVDRYSPLLQWLDDELDYIEADIFSQQQNTRLNIMRLYNLKQQVSQMRHIVSPMQEVVLKLYGTSRIPPICRHLEAYYRDIDDHLTRYIAVVDNLRETINTAIQVSLSMVTIEDNETNKRLAAWAAIFGIPTAIASIWGMNFKFMPELTWKYGYAAALLVILGICLSLYYRFKKLKWI